MKKLTPSFCVDKSYYPMVWRLILSHLAHWPDTEIDSLIIKWGCLLDNSDLFHETPQMDVAGLLIPENLRRQLTSKQSILLTGKIAFALDGTKPIKLGPQSNWELYRARVNILLEEYGSTLPQSSRLI